MQLVGEIFQLLKREFKQEWRMKSVISGLLLYMGCSIFLVYMAFFQMEPNIWLTVFWIILLFASANAVAKSFVQEPKGRMLYLYSVVSPEAVILSKMVYNLLLLLVIAFMGLALYVLLLGNPVIRPVQFILAVLLGTACFSAVFTMASAVSWKAGGNAAMMPILSFPVMIPVIIILLRISQASVREVTDLNVESNLMTMAAMNLIVWALSYVLFPYLWRN